MSKPRLEELVVVVLASGCLEQPTGAAAKIGQVDPAGLRLLGQALGEIDRVVEERFAQRRVLAHVGEDRSLRARGDDRLGSALDPDERAAPVPTPVVANRL